MWQWLDPPWCEKNESLGTRNVERAPNVHYAGTSHYFGWREKAYTTAIAAGTKAAGVSVPGIKFL